MRPSPTPTATSVDLFCAAVLTQRRQRHSGEVADLAVQVRLVGVTGARRPRPPTSSSVVQQPRRRDGSAGCVAASPVRSRRRRAHWRCRVRLDQPTCARHVGRRQQPCPRLPVTWLSCGSDHGAVSFAGSSDAQHAVASSTNGRSCVAAESQVDQRNTRCCAAPTAGTPSSRGSTPGRNRRPTNGSPTARARRTRWCPARRPRRGRPSA